MDDSFDDPMLRSLERDLSAPFPPSRISWRIKTTFEKPGEPMKGLVLAYIDARDVQARLDEVCGLSGWQCRHEDAGDGRLTCSIGIKLEGEWIWKSDGAGGRESNPGLSEQDANKGDFSDAFKRAGVAWGIGRYLYEVSAPWVECEQKGKAKVIKDDQYPKLEALLRSYDEGQTGLVTRGERTMASIVIQALNQFCTSPHDVDTFIEKNAGVLSKMTNAQKTLVWDAMKALKERTLNPGKEAA